MKTIAEALLYGILDTGYVPDAGIPDMARRMIDGGIDLIQLRAKGRDEEVIQRLGEAVVAITEPAGIPLILNDHPEIVPAIGAQGAHVGQEDLPVADARWRAGRALADETPLPLIGKSTHSLVQAVAAQAEGADYIGFGPLFPTPTKPGRPAIGLADIAALHGLVQIPAFCIGGVNAETLPQVIEAGARRVVIVSGILQAADVAAYTRRCRALLEQANR